MQDEQEKLKTQIQQKENEIVKLNDKISKIKNKSMTTEERLNELNKIYEVGILTIFGVFLGLNNCFVLESKSYNRSNLV